MSTSGNTRILVIGHRWPEPASTAAGQRMLGLLRLFREQGWDTIFACASAPGPRPAALRELCEREAFIRLNDSSFNAMVAELQPDLVLFDRFMTEEQFGWRVAEACPRALRVLDTEDLHSLRHARQTYAGATATGRLAPTGIKASFGLMTAETLSFRELAAIYRSDLSLIISRFEYRLLRQAFRLEAGLLHYCPLLLETAADPGPDFADRQDFIWIGNFQHAPNLDAVRWLRDRIWPALRARLPGARMHVYGAYAATTTRQLHDPEQGFLLHGWVEDPGQALREARVCLAPLRFGAGLKGKLLEAMQHGIPSVTTPIGAEGIAPAARWPGAIGKDADALIEAALRLYQDAGFWRERQNRIAACLSAFAAAEHAAKLAARLSRAMATREPDRARNFVGRMLEHHRFNSTRYLSKWIEAKNRSA